MKTIKIKFIGFWESFDINDNFILDILKERYNVEFSEEPDYVFVSPLEERYKYANYPGIRISFTAEPFSADYNSFDYCIDFDDYKFRDRHLRYPFYLLWYNFEQKNTTNSKMNKDDAIEILKNKTIFCNFIYGHATPGRTRERLFETICDYKRVESIGSFMNNQTDGKTISDYRDIGKIEYIKKCKFTIAAESTSLVGFTTEKIAHAFIGNSIPIYYGNPEVCKDFNPKAFINANDFSSLGELVEYVKYVDNNDDVYLQMLCENEFVDANHCYNKHNELKGFLYSIFDQDLEDAYRRNRYYICDEYNYRRKLMYSIMNKKSITNTIYTKYLEYKKKRTRRKKDA